MASIQQELESFTEYVQRIISSGTRSGSIDDLYDQWREAHGSTEDALAIAASLKDLAEGETGRTFETFAAEFAQRNGISDQP